MAAATSTTSSASSDTTRTSNSSNNNNNASAAVGIVAASTGKSIAPATSCSWQQVTENGKCTVEPRTCFDCLNQPLANGDKCTVTPNGLCASIAEYDAAQDYRRPGAAGSFPIHYNYFPSTNTTYCDASDAICQKCRDSTFALADDNPSTHCTGANKCVCVRACELAAWRNETLERLRSSRSAQNATCPIAANASTVFGSSSSSSNDSDVSPTLASARVNKNVYANEDACRWYQNQTFCAAPRSCYDCLNVPIYSGERCMISPLGVCTSMREYDYTRDFRLRPSPSAAHYFPSTNTTYCEPTDAVCAKCRATTFQASASGTVKPTQFCVGASGCVCVAFCESPQWKALVTDATCSAVVVNIAPEQFSIASIALMMMGFTLLFTISVQLLTMWRKRRQAQLEQTRREQWRQRQQERSAFGGMQALQLEGWKSMCQDLISKEQQFLGDARLGGASLLTHGDGPTVVVEEGEGYRPLSPSMHAPPPSRASTAEPPASGRRSDTRSV